MAETWSRRRGSAATGCTVSGCTDRPAEGRRICNEHRAAAEREARILRKDQLRARPCAHEGCLEPRVESDSQVLPYCREHRAERARQADSARRRQRGIPARQVHQPPADMPEGHKWCWACDRILTTSQFHRSRDKSDGLQGSCKSCQYNRFRERMENDDGTLREAARLRGERNRRRSFHKRYGITWHDWIERVAELDSHCQICNLERPLVPDHDHVTGRFRGALCNPCNLSIGQLGDTLAALRAAYVYLGGELPAERVPRTLRVRIGPPRT